MTKLKDYNPSVRHRGQIEQLIVKKVITDLLAAGFALTVDDGDGEGNQLLGVTEVVDAIMNTDEDRLYAYKRGEDKRCFGWILFIYGNDGWDVISDYTTNLEEILKPAHALAEKLENGNYKIVVKES